MSDLCEKPYLLRKKLPETRNRNETYIRHWFHSLSPSLPPSLTYEHSLFPSVLLTLLKVRSKVAIRKLGFLGNLGNLGNLGKYFPSFHLQGFRIYPMSQTKTRKRKHRKITSRGFRVFDLAVIRRKDGVQCGQHKILFSE